MHPLINDSANKTKYHKPNSISMHENPKNRKSLNDLKLDSIIGNPNEYGN